MKYDAELWKQKICPKMAQNAGSRDRTSLKSLDAM